MASIRQYSVLLLLWGVVLLGTGSSKSLLPPSGPSVVTDAGFCESYGNVYTPYPGTDCRYFDQRAGTGPVSSVLNKSHACPSGTKFDIYFCVCADEKHAHCGHAVEQTQFCKENGNLYTVIPGTNCRAFDHRAGPEFPMVKLYCPANTLFDATKCACDYPENVDCRV